jgi:hypothetical protein
LTRTAGSEELIFSGEISQLQSEILHCERLRESMAVEMTKLSEKAEQVGLNRDL